MLPELQGRVYQDVLSLVNSWQLVTGAAFHLSVLHGAIPDRRDSLMVIEAIDNLVTSGLLFSSQHSDGQHLTVTFDGLRRLQALRLAYPDRTT